MREEEDEEENTEKKRRKERNKELEGGDEEERKKEKEKGIRRRYARQGRHIKATAKLVYPYRTAFQTALRSTPWPLFSRGFRL